MDPYRVSAKTLKALAHPTRLQLLYALREGEECVCHLTTLLHERQAYVSQQLMFLRRAGLLVDRKDGLRVYYRVKDARVFDVLDIVSALAGITRVRVERRRMAKCPCPQCTREREKGAKGRERTRKGAKGRERKRKSTK
jgi:ArsR family transcriptional regulator